MTLGDDEFRLFQALIYREAGIWLGPAKRGLVLGRLARRLRALGLEHFSAYYRHVVAGGRHGELVQLLDCITTNETRFFREPRQFEFLERVVVPELRARGPRRLRVWSAGCATGQEPYSVAMLLLDALPAREGFCLEVTATDLSTRVLATAAAARWPIERAAEIPTRYLKAFMLRGSGAQAGVMKAGDQLRACVRFERLNLSQPPYVAAGRFDLVLCRNVLIYFDLAAKTRVIERLIPTLAPGGHLLLGHAESLNGITRRLGCVAPSIYRAPARGDDEAAGVSA